MNLVDTIISTENESLLVQDNYLIVECEGLLFLYEFFLKKVGFYQEIITPLLLIKALSQLL